MTRCSRLSLLLSFTILAILANSCGGDSTGPINKNLALAITESPNPQRDTVAPGDTIGLSIIASGPSSPIMYTVVRVTGAIEEVDSVFANGVVEVRRNLTVHVPMSATLRSSFTISVKTADASGQVVTKTLPSFTILDPDARPVLTGTLSTTHASGAQPGDILTLSIAATDRHKLKYIGYRFGPPANIADSVATSEMSDTLVRHVVVLPEWAGVSAYSAFAIDSADNSVTFELGRLTVSSRARRPITSVALPGQLYDVAVDTKRNVVYMSVPDAHQVAVLSLATMTFGTPLSFDAMPQGLDLTSGGDTLAVSLYQDRAIALIDLRTGTTTATIPIPVGAYPTSLRVSDHDKILVTTAGGSGTGGLLLEADPVTGISDTLAEVTGYATIGASGNRSRIMTAADNSCCPLNVYLYDSSLRMLISQGGAGDLDGYVPEADYAGDRYLLGNVVFTWDRVQKERYTGLFDEGRGVLSSDGSSGYFADETQVYHARLSDGAILDTFQLGEHAQNMWISRDGSTLLVPGGSHLFVIDLW